MPETILYVLKSTLAVLLDVLSLAMLCRAIFSWFDQTEESRFSGFLYMLTEPVILPIRKLCQRMRWFEGSPLDFPFLLTMILLSLFGVLLST